MKGVDKAAEDYRFTIFYDPGHGYLLGRQFIAGCFLKIKKMSSPHI